jgi:integrase
MTEKRGLTALQVKSAKPRDKDWKLPDERGLFLQITPAGVKLWRVRNFIPGTKKEYVTSLGRYPDVDLAEARRRRDELKRDYARNEGRFAPPPPAAKPSLRDMTVKWLDTRKPGWRELRHEDKNWRVMQRLFAHANLGDTPFNQVTRKALLEALREQILPASIDIAHRTAQRLRTVFDFAMGEYDDVDTNPAVRLGDNLPEYAGTGRRPAITDLAEAREMLAKVESGKSRRHSRLAMRLLALTALRPTELLHGHWAEIEGDVWHVPARRGGKLNGMKMREAHDVPLSLQARFALEELHEITGSGQLMFWSWASQRSPLDVKSLEVMLKTAGYGGRHVPHGWRSTFSTNMNSRPDQLPHDKAVVELMLSHKPQGVGARYDRSLHFDRRRELAQLWADMLDGR